MHGLGRQATEILRETTRRRTHGDGSRGEVHEFGIFSEAAGITPCKR